MYIVHNLLISTFTSFVFLFPSSFHSKVSLLLWLQILRQNFLCCPVFIFFSRRFSFGLHPVHAMGYNDDNVLCYFEYIIVSIPYFLMNWTLNIPIPSNVAAFLWCCCRCWFCCDANTNFFCFRMLDALVFSRNLWWWFWWMMMIMQ